MIGILERIRDMGPQYEARVTVDYQGEKIEVFQFGNQCQAIVSETYEPFARLSVSIEQQPPKDSFWLKAWSENEHFVKELVESGVIELLEERQQVTQWVSVRAARVVKKDA
jgi:hypothetical protein